MARIVLNEAADLDVGEIFDSIRENAGYAAAVAHNTALDRLYNQIATFPESGSPRPNLGFGIRIGIIAPYLVIYRYDVATDTAFVLRVLHGRRNIESTSFDPLA